MNNLKIIQIKSGLYLFLFSIVQMSVIFLFFKDGEILLGEKWIQENIWVYFNLMTVITVLMGFRMGRVAIDEIVKSNEIGYVGVTTMLRLNVFIFCSSLILFYGYYMLIYESLDFFSFIISLLSILLISILAGFVILIIPSLFLGAIYGFILKNVSKPLLP